MDRMTDSRLICDGKDRNAIGRPRWDGSGSFFTSDGRATTIKERLLGQESALDVPVMFDRISPERLATKTDFK